MRKSELSRGDRVEFETSDGVKLTGTVKSIGVFNIKIAADEGQGDWRSGRDIVMSQHSVLRKI